MQAQHILVTGGFGYVGSRLVPHLLGLGHRVRVLDLMLYGESGLEACRRDPNYADWKDRFDLVVGDLRDAGVVAAVVSGIDTIIHLAAISNDPTGEVDEVLTRQVNFDAVAMLIGLARRAGVRRFINASSSSVFGIQNAADVTEDLEPAPLTAYSRHKMLSEWLVVAAAAPEFCTVNIRPATICGYSPRQRFDLTVNKLTADAVRKRVITVHGGEQRRPNVGMTDMIRLYGELVGMATERINGRTFNFGFENHKIIDIARMIQGILSDLKVEVQVTATLDNRDYHISSRRMIAQLGYQPVSSIRQEVLELRRVLESGRFPDIEAPEYYNMRTMKLGRHAGAYQYLAG
jgi:nucleoside-diphosphate-sugar epimerase